MFYFFERESQYVRCEVRLAPGALEACELVVSENGEPERIELYPDWKSAEARWQELRARLAADGWKGPLGRE